MQPEIFLIPQTSLQGTAPTPAGMRVPLPERLLLDVLRMEPDFLMIRGRMAGTSDAGRVFMFPYGSIHYLAFQKAMKVEEVNAVFSGTPLSRKDCRPRNASKLSISWAVSLFL